MHRLRFRTILTVSALIGTLGASSFSALAQRPGGQPGGPPGGQGGRGGGRFGGGRQMSVAMLPVTTLDTIVKLTPDQKKKVTQIHDGFAKASEGARPQPGQRFDPAAMEKMRTASEQATKDIEAVLTPAQKTKLEAARKEMGTYRMAGIPMGMYGQLKLTADQKTKLAEIQKSMTPPQGGGGAGGGGDFQAMRAAMQANREKAAAILTAEQKAQIEQYLKAHPEEQRRGRGGAGGPGGGGRGGRGGQP